MRNWLIRLFGGYTEQEIAEILQTTLKLMELGREASFLIQQQEQDDEKLTIH